MSKLFDFWQDHSDIFLAMAFLWDRRKKLERPDGYGRKTGSCGDTISMYLAIEHGVISEIAFEIEGCINTNACCNALATLVEGRTIEDSWTVTTDAIIAFLKTLPEDHHHCAELTVGTLYLALNSIDPGKIHKSNQFKKGEPQ